MIRYTLKQARQIFRENGCKLLATEYRGNDAAMPFRCECGRVGCIRMNDLCKGGRCGCKRKTHGHATRTKPSRTYITWSNMIQRCTNPDYNRYADYGGRGIKVCRRWLTFENFLADMGERPPHKSIDRIKVNGNYEPGNCQWATSREQRTNRRKNSKWVDTKGSDKIGKMGGQIAC